MESRDSDLYSIARLIVIDGCDSDADNRSSQRFDIDIGSLDSDTDNDMNEIAWYW